MDGNATPAAPDTAAAGAPPVADAAPRRALVAALIAGAGAAITVPLARPGVGWSLGAGVVTGAAVLAIRAVRPAGRPVDRAAVAWRWCFGALAFALLGMAALRAAGWLLVGCLVTAAASGALAVGRGRWPARWRPSELFTDRYPPSYPPQQTWAWAARGIRLPGGTETLKPLARGVAAAAVLLLVFGGLLAGADRAFRTALAAAPVLAPGRLAQLCVLFGAGAGAVLLAAGAARDVAAEPAHPAGDPPAPRRSLRRLEWVPALVVLDALFAWFIAVQLPRLFGAEDYILRPGGPDFAEYARDGFGLLLVVAALTLAVIVAVGRYAAGETPADRWLVRLLAGPLCLLTLVVLASANHRLGLYVGAYGYTRPRLVGLAAAGFLFGILLLLMVAGARRWRTPWLRQATALAAVVTVLGLVAANPDAVVADTVIKRYEKDRHLDADYLSGLSADAVTAIDRLPEPQRTCLLRAVTADLGRADPWYAYNAGRRRAREILATRPLRPDACPWAEAAPHRRR